MEDNHSQSDDENIQSALDFNGPPLKKTKISSSSQQNNTHFTIWPTLNNQKSTTLPLLATAIQKLMLSYGERKNIEFEVRLGFHTTDGITFSICTFHFYIGNPTNYPILSPSILKRTPQSRFNSFISKNLFDQILENYASTANQTIIEYNMDQFFTSQNKSSPRLTFIPKVKNIVWDPINQAALIHKNVKPSHWTYKEKLSVIDVLYPQHPNDVRIAAMSETTRPYDPSEKLSGKSHMVRFKKRTSLQFQNRYSLDLTVVDSLDIGRKQWKTTYEVELEWKNEKLLQLALEKARKSFDYSLLHSISLSFGQCVDELLDLSKTVALSALM